VGCYKTEVAKSCPIISGVAKEGESKWEHGPWGAGLGGATTHFLQSF